jgi:hypothetical protein
MQVDELSNFASIEIQQFITKVEDLTTSTNWNASNNHWL